MNKKNPISENDVDRYFKILEHNINWIQNCDTKASVMLGVLGFIYSVVGSSFGFSVFWKIMQDGHWKAVILGAISFLAVSASATGILFYCLLFYLEHVDTKANKMI